MSEQNVFTRGELTKVAPWVAKELKRSRDPAPHSEAHSMHEWIKLVGSSHSELWHAIDAQG